MDDKLPVGDRRIVGAPLSDLALAGGRVRNQSERQRGGGASRTVPNGMREPREDLRRVSRGEIDVYEAFQNLARSLVPRLPCTVP